MIALLPPFLENEHYRELSPAEGEGRYRFRTLLPVTVLLQKDPGVRLSFRDPAGREWLRLDRRLVTIAEGYAWNGNSPKRWYPVIGWVGTPDPVRTRLGSAFHDALCQFSRVPEMPFSQSEIDLVFLHILLRARFTFARSWHGAVKDFGALFAHAEPGIHAVPLGREVDTGAGE